VREESVSDVESSSTGFGDGVPSEGFLGESAVRFEKEEMISDASRRKSRLLYLETHLRVLWFLMKGKNAPSCIHRLQSSSSVLELKPQTATRKSGEVSSRDEGEKEEVENSLSAPTRGIPKSWNWRAWAIEYFMYFQVE